MKLDMEQWDKSLGDLYQTVLQPALLTPALTGINAMMDSDFCHLFGITSAGEESFTIVTNKDRVAAVEQYAQEYGRIDPRRHFVDSVPTGQTYRCSSICGPAFVARSAFYQDYLIPHDLRYLIGACLYRGERQSIYVGFNHGAGRADFTDEEHRHFSALGTHLKRTVETLIQAAPVAQAFAVSEFALNALHYGVIGINALRNVTFANQFAENCILGRPRPDVVHGKLVDGSELDMLFRQVRADGRAHSLRIRSTTPLYVTALPFSCDPGEHGYNALQATVGTAVVLIFSLGKSKKMASPSQLMQWFPLTPAEARLAHELGSGMSIDDYALKYHVGVPTARTQLRALLKKTGEERQQDLVRMLISLPSPAIFS